MFHHITRAFITTTHLPISRAALPNIFSRCPTRPRVFAMTTSDAPSLAQMRMSYSLQPLIEHELPTSPVSLFSTWLSQAAETTKSEANAMCLSTVWDNRPSSRMVLLKKFDACGFVWYTNYNSRKAKQLEKNPHAALTFWWPETERSVRVEGMVCRTSEEESDEYFESRPLESRLGAMASEQSAVVESRHVVEMRWEGLKRRFVGGEGEFIEDVVRPKWWGGYRLRPTYMEFWKGRHARLHDRIVYECDDGDAMGDGTDVKWRRKRLQP